MRILPALLAGILGASLGQVASAQPEPMRIGVCCHPGHTKNMLTDWEQVFGWITGCGMDLCRIDWGSDWALNEEILQAADRAGVELLPVLFPPAPAEDTEDAWYAASLEYGRQCGDRYRDRIRYFELSNERDCRCMTKWPGGGDRDGAAMTDYDEALYAPIRGMMRGLSDGLKQTHPDCITMVDTAGWLHFGFIDLLVRDKVPFDVVAWHWYSEMGDPLREIESYSGRYRLLERIGQWGKPIWFTEGNRRNGALDGAEQEQAEYLEQTIKTLAGTGKVDAYVVYELFDEPYLLAHGGEVCYGIVHCEWGLSLGQEFPGAKASIGLQEHGGVKSLALDWNFSAGGRYVSMNWLPRNPVDADEMRLRVRGDPGEMEMLVRFVDAGGQHLQLSPRVQSTGEWQAISVPVRGPWNDHWAGANDGTVHQPLRGVWIGVQAGQVVSGKLELARAELVKDGETAYAFDFSTDPVFTPRPAWERLKAMFATSK